MARAKAKLDLTLFPFLSVLAGMIAVMMLFMMITLGTRVIGDDDESKKPSPPPPPSKIKVDDLEEPELSDEEGINPERYEKLKQEVLGLSAILAERRTQHKELALAVEQLEGLIEVKKNEIEVVGVTQTKPGRKLGEPTLVDVVPVNGVNALRKKPHYVEVVATGYILQPSKKSFPMVKKTETAARDEFTVDSGLREFLASVNVKRNKEFIVFLIHPNGTTAFLNLLGYIDREYPYRPKAIDQYDVGWEPFSREWLLIPDKK